MTDFAAGCVQLWIRSSEPPVEHRYENWNNKNVVISFADTSSRWVIYISGAAGSAPKILCGPSEPHEVVARKQPVCKKQQVDA